MRYDSRASDPSTSSLFFKLRTTLRSHLHRLLGLKEILRMTAEQGAIDGDLLALTIHTLDRLVGVESDVAPVQARELFVVVEVVLALDQRGEVLRLAFPLHGHDALDEARPARDEGLDEVLHGPFAGEGVGREVVRGEGAAEAGRFVEVDVVEAGEVGAVAEAVFALVFVAAFAGLLGLSLTDGGRGWGGEEAHRVEWMA